MSEASTSLFRRQNENGYISRGYIVVDKEKQIVQVDVSSLIPDAKRRLGRYASTTDELPAYPKDRGLMSVLVCPLGGTYQLHGPTLTCLSHPDGPISVTRKERRYGRSLFTTLNNL